jgi:hypothetical protein
MKKSTLYLRYIKRTFLKGSSQLYQYHKRGLAQSLSHHLSVLHTPQLSHRGHLPEDILLF